MVQFRLNKKKASHLLSYLLMHKASLAKNFSLFSLLAKPKCLIFGEKSEQVVSKGTLVFDKPMYIGNSQYIGLSFMATPHNPHSTLVE